jgi:hypothetical protein
MGYGDVSVRIGSDKGGGVKSLLPAEVRLVAEALAADLWPTETFQSLTFVFLQATPRRRVPGAQPKGRQRRRRIKTYRRM